MFKKLLTKLQEQSFSMRTKLIISLSSIAVTLLVSCIISVLEYSSMSNYVSSLIVEDVNSINIAGNLQDRISDYNLQILALIGDETTNKVPEYDYDYFKTQCMALRNADTSPEVKMFADSVMYSYAAYVLTSFELEDVMASNFIDSRSWYFERLQPKFNRLKSDVDKLSDAVLAELKNDSRTFDRGFYRSIIPGIVAVGAGLLLVIMLLLFILAYYVNPLRRMLSSLEAYRANDKKYTCVFDGDDELLKLNDGIADITSENQQLRARISALKSKQK